MNRRNVLSRRWIAGVSAALFVLTGAAFGDPYEDLVKYDWSESRAPLAAIEVEIRQAATPAARRAVEARLLEALDHPEATPQCKQFVCRMLRRAGSSACVPAMAKLLPDAKLSHAARFALQDLACPEAAAALREALGQLKGKLRIGVIASIGARRDAKAVPALAKLLRGGDVDLTRAAVRALGHIASAEAAESLARAKVPAELRAELADASLLCADRTLADGKGAAAAGIYRRMFAKGHATPVRIAALRGIVLSEKARAAGTLLRLMKDQDVDIRQAASRFIIEMPGKAATKAFAAALASLSPDEQVKLIDALVARGDVAAAPEVTRLIDSTHEGVRIAAIKALAVMGDASSVARLAKAVSAGGAVGEAATDSLNRLKGEGVSEAMARLLDSPEPQLRSAILNVLTTRADKTMTPAMLKAARDKDENVRKAAIQGLTAVAGEKELGELVGLLLAAGSASERGAVQRALSSAALRVDDLDARAAPLVAALARAGAAAKVALISVLGRLGGEKALAAVRGQLEASSTDVATEAVRALHSWPDPAPAADLLRIIKTTKDRTRKVLAFRGYIRMANMPSDRSAAETTAMYEQALRLATSAAEKKSVLSGLANARSPEALKLVAGLLGEEALKAEAELACVQIAGNARDAAPDEARAALRKVIDSTKNDSLRQKARGILNEMDKYRGYITSWLVSGPYTEGSSYETPYPPEKKGAGNVQWQVLSKGVGAQVIDLKQAFGGDNRAVYLKTGVSSPTDQDVLLEMGSDDGIKVWINGKLVHANNANRPCRPAEDKAKARLRKGWNALLVKISQNGGDWAFSIRICRPDGAALEGLRVNVEGK